LPDLEQLHRRAREIFDHALSSVDPRHAINRAIKVNGAVVDVGEARLDASARPIYAIAIGKAANSMALGLDDVLGPLLTAGVLTSSAPLATLTRWQGFAGGHPLPNEASLAAARAAFELLDRANEQGAAVIFLISGGGSAMMEWPVDEEITLADLQTANQILVGCGARIAEVNAVRRAFSAVKGGGLARRAPRAQIVTLIVSDTNRGDEAGVASGPTFAAPREAPLALEVIAHYQLENRLPQSIVTAVRAAKHQTEPVQGSHLLLLDNMTALEAARDKATELGFACEILGDVCEQPIELGCELLVSSLLSGSEPACAVSGGEFSCPVRGDGRGGRNLETALRCAIRLDQASKSSHFVVLSAGTDGIDGNSPAAGAIADETTLSRARDLSLNAPQYLERSDSYMFFEHLNTLIVTGPTGTNVRDLRILLRSS